MGRAQCFRVRLSCFSSTVFSSEFKQECMHTGCDIVLFTLLFMNSKCSMKGVDAMFSGVLFLSRE